MDLGLVGLNMKGVFEIELLFEELVSFGKSSFFLVSQGF